MGKGDLDKALAARDELLRLVSLKAMWPHCGTREEFPHEVSLKRALEEAHKAVFG